MEIKQEIAKLFKKAGDSLMPAPSITSNLRMEVGPNDSGVSLLGLHISVDSLYTIWRNNSDVFACVRERSENVGSQGFKWINVQDEKKEPNPKSVATANEIIEFNHNFQKLKKRLVSDESITGNAYLLVQKNESGKVIGLQIVDPRTLRVVTDKYGRIIKWLQVVNAETAVFEPDEILQFKVTDDPNSPVYGLSALEPVVFEVRTDLAAMVSNYAFFQNDAQPGAMYILEDTTGEGDREAIINQLRKELRGSENRHKSVILAGVKEIKTIGINQKDMEFHTLRKFTTEKVCSVYGVPKSILNYTEDVNLANGQEQTAKFWEGTIQPLEMDLETFFNKTVLPAIGITDIKIKFNERKFENREFNENSSRLDVAMGVMTINEARKMRNLEPYEESVEGVYVNKPILFGGAGAVPLDDVGVTGDIINPDETIDQAAKFLDGLERRYTYARKPKAKN